MVEIEIDNRSGVDVDEPERGRLRHPGAPFRMWEGSYGVDPAPTLGSPLDR